MNTKLIRFFLLPLVFLVGGLSVFAQNERITGKVVCKGEPVIAASVVISGTTVGTATDLD